MAFVAGSRITIPTSISTFVKGKIFISNSGNQKVKADHVHGFLAINGDSNLKPNASFGQRRSFTRNLLLKASSGEGAIENTLEDSVRKMVAKQMGVKLEELANNATFIEDLGADSLDLIELMNSLEDEFDFVVDDETTQSITTTQKAIDLVNKILNEK
ncbi:hypothetical protein LUZ60_011214 [Juncus effusus]|nr:hypothetical protein LUZ60_011214 [Juncus effusus]